MYFSFTNGIIHPKIQPFYVFGSAITFFWDCIWSIWWSSEHEHPKLVPVMEMGHVLYTSAIENWCGFRYISSVRCSQSRNSFRAGPNVLQACIILISAPGTKEYPSPFRGQELVTIVWVSIELRRILPLVCFRTILRDSEKSFEKENHQSLSATFLRQPWQEIVDSWQAHLQNPQHERTTDRGGARTLLSHAARGRLPESYQTLSGTSEWLWIEAPTNL